MLLLNLKRLGKKEDGVDNSIASGIVLLIFQLIVVFDTCGSLKP